MKKHLQDFAKKPLNKDFEALPKREQEIIKHLYERLPISRNINQEFETKTTSGQKLADQVATFGGSWTFISIFGAILLAWIILNSLLLVQSNNSFDPYPYILLNLFLSTLAAIQAPIILMSQNRHSGKDRVQAEHDYEVNLKAELEILGSHEKIDELTESKWKDLLLMQQQQI